MRPIALALLLLTACADRPEPPCADIAAAMAPTDWLRCRPDQTLTTERVGSTDFAVCRCVRGDAGGAP